MLAALAAFALVQPALADTTVADASTVQGVQLHLSTTTPLVGRGEKIELSVAVRNATGSPVRFVSPDDLCAYQLAVNYASKGYTVPMNSIAYSVPGTPMVDSHNQAPKPNFCSSDKSRQVTQILQPGMLSATYKVAVAVTPSMMAAPGNYSLTLHSLNTTSNPVTIQIAP